MHVTPALAPQQSLVVLHLSPFCEQPWGCDWQTGAPPSASEAQ
jgi:hypothetical protein